MVAEAAEALSTKAATADGQDTSLTVMAEGFKQSIAALQAAVDKLTSMDAREALQAARGVTG